MRERERIGRTPPLWPGEGWRGLAYPVLAVVLVAAALHREGDLSAPLDPIAVGLRALAAAFALRGLPALLELGRRVRLTLGAAQHRLRLTEDELRWESPSETRAVARADVVAVHAGAGSRQTDRVWIIHRPDAQGRALLGLPPIFGDARTLATDLRTWRGEPPEPAAEVPAPARRGSQVYDAAAQGRLPAGTAVIRHGAGWLRRIPFAAVLAASVFLDGALRTPKLQLGYLGLLPWAGVLVCMAIPIGWLVVAAMHVRPRRGLALVATPAEVLMRTRHGIVRASWPHLDAIEIASEPALTVLEGWTRRRRLVLRRDGDRHPVRYDEAFLGVPADAAAALLEGYRSGRMQSPG